MFVEVGKTITVLCAVLNDGEVPIRVDKIGGVLNTLDMQYSLQNITVVSATGTELVRCLSPTLITLYSRTLTR